ncbi:MAG: hypothetical protein L0216_07245 [Planctomycetales bacterium]|nr:hypothetical protein [Planctomycetales bacterium]
MRALLLLGGLGLAGAGCASVPADPLADPRIEALGHVGTLPWTVAVLVEAPVETAPPEPSAGDGSVPVAPDAEALGRDLADALARLGLLRAARALPGAPAPLPELVARAWDGGDDLLLRVEIRSARVAYLGRNLWWIPNILLWLQFWFPSFWVPDEDFSYEIEGDLALHAAATGACLHRRPFSARVARGLDDFERGWDLLGVFRPGFLFGPGNARAAAEALEAEMRREAVVVALEKLAREAPELAARGGGLQKTLVLAVGVERYRDPAIPPAAGAARDAQALARALGPSMAGSGPGPGAPSVRLALDAEATADGLRRLLRDHIGRRLRPGDRAVLFFAGRAGVVADPAGPELVLAPHDLDPADARRGCLGLSEIARLVSAPAGSSLALVLDAGPGGSVPDRGLPHPAPPGDLDAALASAADRAGVSLLLAGGVGEGAATLGGGERGLFSASLERALRAAPDADGNGTSTLHEAFLRARERTMLVALLEGRSQTPRHFGPPSDLVVGPPPPRPGAGGKG